MPVCDICEKPMEWGEGYGLNTTQVTTSEGYWKYLLSSLWSDVHENDPLGEYLGNFVQKQCSDISPWLVCDSCGTFLEIDQQSARKYNKQGAKPPGLGPANLSDAGLAAAYAWSALYDSWPEAISIRESKPEPGDMSSCDFCRRSLYLDEALSLLKEPVVQAYEKLGGFKRRGPASQNIKGNNFWIACPLCMQRAHRIIGPRASLVAHHHPNR